MSWSNSDTVATKKDGVDSEDLNLDMDSIGLGVFDAFFASLSMILVSEVGLIDSLPTSEHFPKNWVHLQNALG